MKILSLSIAVVLTSSFVVSSCGKKKEDDKATSKSMPAIGLTLPESADTATTLTTAGLSGIITNWQKRVNNITDRINKELELLNAVLDKLDGPGSFKDKGPNSNISGSIVEETGTYNYTATICVGGKVYTKTSWSTDGANVFTSRDMNNAPTAANVKNFAVEVTYTAAADKTLTVNSYGNPLSDKGLPEGHLATDILSERVVAKQLGATSEFVLTGANAWMAAGETEMSDNGYIVGKISAAGDTGEYVAAAERFVDLGACTEMFSEATQNWCVGRSLAAAKRFTDAERTAAWARLKVDAPLTPSSALKAVAVTGTCP